MPEASRVFRVRRTVLIALAGGLPLLGAILAFAYTTFQNDIYGVPAPSLWPNASFTWVLNNPGPPANVDTTDGTNPLPLKTVLMNSANSWAAASLNGQQLTSLSIANGIDVTNLPNPQIDCTNVVSFDDNNPADFPTGTASVAFTAVSTDYYGKGGQLGKQPGTYTFTECNGQETINTTFPSIVFDADIAFNPSAQFSTSTPPLSNYFDLQAVATHEFGHALGLDHSGVAHAVMFPAGDTGESQQRTLSTDDIIAISFLYPSSSFASYLGTISGQVTFPNLGGVYAAHVVATDASTGNVVVDGLANADGTYKLFVPPGSYNVLVLPLAPDDNHGIYSLSDFSGWTCGYDESAPPCCDTAAGQCLGAPLTNPTNFTGKFY
jgi:hypothetical protein